MTTISAPTTRSSSTALLGATVVLAVVWFLAAPLGTFGGTPATDVSLAPANGTARAVGDTSPPAPSLAHRPAVHPAAATEGPVPVALGAAAAEHGLDEALVRAVAWVESSFRPTVTSDVGAVGVMQLMPDTVTHAEVLVGRALDPLAVDDNVRGGTAYLAHLLDRAEGDVGLALAAYHQGWTGVHRDGVSPTTDGYVDRVLDVRARLEADIS